MPRPTRAYVRARATAITARPIRTSDTPHLREIKVGATGATTRQHKPRNTWHQRGWTEVSPFYSNTTTIDSRWDKS